MGLQRIEKTHAESPNGLFQDSDSVKDTSVLEVAPLSIICQTLYCETREKVQQLSGTLTLSLVGVQVGKDT